MPCSPCLSPVSGVLGAQRTLFRHFSQHFFALLSPSKSALFCRARGTAKSLGRGNFSVNLCRKFAKETPSRNLRENRSVFIGDNCRFRSKEKIPSHKSEKNQRATTKGQNRFRIFTLFTIFTLFHNFSPRTFPFKQRVLAQGEQKRRKIIKRTRQIDVAR